MAMLAPSPWPRTGADSANSAATPINGPSVVRMVQHITLPRARNHLHKQLPAGALVAGDRSLRVVSDGFLSAVEETGALRWTLDLHTLDSDRERPFFHSFPVILADGDTVILVRHTLVRLDQEARQVARVEDNSLLQDSPLSPNVTSGGDIVVASLLGALVVWQQDGLRQLAIDGLGYDLETPSLFADDSLAVAGYAGRGLCRINLDGTVRWQTTHKDFDLVPCIGPDQCVAAGSANGSFSAIFSADGGRLGIYNHAAMFAVHPNGGWVARSGHEVALLTPTGRCLWCHSVGRGDLLSACAPLVDGVGRIYIRHPEGVVCYEANGNVLFDYPVAFATSAPLSLIAEGVLALVAEHQLLLLR